MRQIGIWRSNAFPFGEGAPVRTLGRKRAVKRKSFLMFRRNDRSLSRPRLRSATLPEGEGIGRLAAKFQFLCQPIPDKTEKEEGKRLPLHFRIVSYSASTLRT